VLTPSLTGPAQSGLPVFTALLPLRAAQELGASLRQSADLTVLRGLLALEVGEDRSAERHFRRALAAAGPFNGRPAAERYLRLLTAR
jgi:hypothetical protein